VIRAVKKTMPQITARNEVTMFYANEELRCCAIRANKEMKESH
jgi:hypothetical protein